MTDGIFCFVHCEPKCRVFCVQVPPHCPLCGVAITRQSVSADRIASPLSRAKQTPCSLVIRPTNGDFLHFYENAADLHIGITDSSGEVCEFDSRGISWPAVNANNSVWNECISIGVHASADSVWQHYWDCRLRTAARLECWEASKYCERTNNCYSFVMSFLRTLHLKDLEPSLHTKTQFCKDFIVNRTKSAAKYIALYRKIMKERVIILNKK